MDYFRRIESSVETHLNMNERVRLPRTIYRREISGDSHVTRLNYNSISGFQLTEGNTRESIKCETDATKRRV